MQTRSIQFKPFDFRRSPTPETRASFLPAAICARHKAF